MNPREILQKEGFRHIYEWHDEPGKRYQNHSHKGRVTIFVTHGDVNFTFPDGTVRKVVSGERFDVPVGMEHTATVGSNGCNYVVGEMIKGDS